MRKTAIFLCTILCLPLLADDTTKTTVEATQGYRFDRLCFSISGPHKKPNILSELTFKNIQIYQSRLLTTVEKSGYFGTLQLGYGKILNGRVQDSDYAASHRKVEFSRSHAHVCGSYTFDGSLACGFHYAYSPAFTLSPQLGYTLDIQNFHMHKGVQKKTISKRGLHRIHKAIDGLQSTYRATWDGPFFGTKMTYQLTPSLTLLGESNLFFALKYHAKARWNLRRDLKGHITQESKRLKGCGAMLLAGAKYAISDRSAIDLEGLFTYLLARGGIDTKRFHSHKKAQVPFHRAELFSSELRLAFEWQF
jgi:hypothetical protein